MATRYEHVSGVRHLLHGGPGSWRPGSSTQLGVEPLSVSEGQLAMCNSQLSEHHGVGAGRYEGRSSQGSQVAAAQDLRAVTGGMLQGALQAGIARGNRTRSGSCNCHTQEQSGCGGSGKGSSIRQNDSRPTRPVKWIVRPLGYFPSRGNSSQNIEAQR